MTQKRCSGERISLLLQSKSNSRSLDWTVIGINYQKANLEQRQRYALSEEQILKTYDLFKNSQIPTALIISTCNRTEFFVPTELKMEASQLLSKEVYRQLPADHLFHIKEDNDAISYFFRICSGLESQIAGDFEILGQVRKAFRIAKEKNMLSGVWERTINSALAAAKKARSQTGFYSGATSTSYASIEHLKNSDIDLKQARYLILGAGKIGSHSIDHLLKFVPAHNITVSNRSLDKAIELASKKGLNILPFQHLKKEAKKYDVIICATNAPHFILSTDMFDEEGKHHLIDLSVPMNIDPALKSFPKVNLVNVDELSEIINANLEKRHAERSSVEEIISEALKDLNAWFTIKSGIPMLTELRKELEQLKSDALSNVSADNIEHSSAFLDEYTDEFFNQLSQQWIKKVRNKSLNAN